MRSAKYCITTGSSCTPNIDANLSNNEYGVGLESNASAQRVCSIVTDQAGNESDIECSNAYLVDGVVGSSSFSIQSQTAGNSGWYQALTLKVSLSDIHSGVSSAKYCVTTGSSCTPNVNARISNNAYSVTLGSNASAQRVCSIVTDQAGNTSATQCSGAYSVDTVNPVAKITASVSGNSITVSGASSSDVDSKIASYQYSKDGTNYSSSTSSTFNFTGLNDGSYTVYLKVVDKSGRVSSPVSTNVDVAYVNVYVSSSGNDSTGFGSSSKPFATLAKAYSRVKSGGTILLLSNITQSSTASFNTANKSVTLKSNGSSIYKITKASSLTTSILSVLNTNTLTTSNIIFDGNNVASSQAVLYFNEHSTYNMNAGTTIQNGKNSNVGGGLYLYNGTLNISGGVIQNNSSSDSSGGGGVAAWVATVTMTGGTIQNNTTTGNAGGICTAYSRFIMSGGTIYNNSASGTLGGGIASWGNNTSITISGTAKIQNNKYGAGGGIALSYNSDGAASLTVNGGTISGNTAATSGGGIAGYSNSVISLNGGTITGNSAKNGGGIYVTSATTKLLSSSIKITNNTASASGGGISGYAGTFEMSAGEISGNKATGNDGGGIDLWKTTATLKGGTIKSNTAGNVGGGIKLYEAKLTMTGGSITANKSVNGSGICVNENSTLTLNGGSITSNIANSGYYGVYISSNSTYSKGSTSISGNTPNNANK